MNQRIKELQAKLDLHERDGKIHAAKLIRDLQTEWARVTA